MREPPLRLVQGGLGKDAPSPRAADARPTLAVVPASRSLRLIAGEGRPAPQGRTRLVLIRGGRSLPPLLAVMLLLSLVAVPAEPER